MILDRVRSLVRCTRFNKASEKFLVVLQVVLIGFLLLLERV
jgi:hypothetical protein